MVFATLRKSFRCCVKKRQYLLRCDSGEERDKCSVQLLDGLEISVSIPKLALGKDAMQAVLRQLDLPDHSDYFGLQHAGRNNDFCWLDPTKEVRKQLKPSERPFVLYFRVKFYIAEPHLLNEELTRYHFFLQVKNDVMTGRVNPPQRTAIDMAAYAVQSELGDFDAGIHREGYVSEFNLINNQTEEVEKLIERKHRLFAGLTPAECESKYLKIASCVDGYGVDSQQVQGQDGKSHILEMSPQGISTRRQNEQATYHRWDHITRINFKGKRIIVRVENDHVKELIFQLPSNLDCKVTWKRTIDHHRFHLSEERNAAVTRERTNSGKLKRSRSNSYGRQRSTMGYIRVGSNVWTRVQSGDYYQGVVTVISNKVYVKLNNDGDTVAHERNDDASVVYDMQPNADELNIGTPVIAHWSGVPALLPGVITKIDGDKYHVLYDDRDKAVKRIDQIRVLKPPRYFGPGSGRTKIQKKFSMKTTSLTTSGRSDVSYNSRKANNSNSFDSAQLVSNTSRPRQHVSNGEARGQSGTTISASNYSDVPRVLHKSIDRGIDEEDSLSESVETIDSANESKGSSSSSHTSRGSGSSDQSSESLLSSSRSHQSVDSVGKHNKNRAKGKPHSDKSNKLERSSQSFSYSRTREDGVRPLDKRAGDMNGDNKRTPPLNGRAKEGFGAQSKYGYLVAGRYNDLSRIGSETIQVHSVPNSHKGLYASDVPLIHRTMSNIEDTRRHKITKL